MNWLSRFLHIKPASKTLCFQVARGKVRGDLVRLLRDWQRFGVRDVTFDRNDNTINARVDKTNRKSLSCSVFLFSAWRLEDFCFDVEILKVEPMSRSNCAPPYQRSPWPSEQDMLTRSLYRPQDQASLIRYRALCCPRAWAASQALPGPIHPNPWRSIELPQGCRHCRGRLPRQLYAGRGSREADYNDGGALLRVWKWNCRFTPEAAGHMNSWWYIYPRKRALVA
jgi:hypothetical protein